LAIPEGRGPHDDSAAQHLGSGGKQGGTATREDRLIGAKVAFLRSQGISQVEIARRLALTASTVSRLLAPGGDAHKYLAWEQPKFQWGMVRDDVDEIRALQGENEPSVELTQRLTEIYGVRIKVNVILTHVIDNPKLHEQKFYSRAAELVWKLLGGERINIVGVTWGKSLELLLTEAQKLHLAPPLKRATTEVIPLVGESLGASFPTSRSSSSLAQSFAEALVGHEAGEESENEAGKNKRKIYALTMCPVFLPASFKQHEVDVIKELLSFVPSYREIFGNDDNRYQQASSQTPLAVKIDAILTGISRQGLPFGMGDDPKFVKKIGLQMLNEVLVGDLGGLPLFAPTADLPKRKKANDFYESHWLGLKYAHVHETARRARAHIVDGPPGVIVITTGAERAVPIHEAVKGEIINELIIDDSAADALSKILPR
jgi:DNA-binding transcriptional regulator LsrR (DeoR family)